MWKRNEDEPDTPYQSSHTPSPRPAAPSTEPRGRAVIGESIRIEGDILGDDDLLVQGQVEGKISLPKNSVTVGRSGRVKADIQGRQINVEGQVQGNLFADEQVVVRESGEVRGNITAPRVNLEDGSKFKGSIDMEPKTRSASAGGASTGATASAPGGAGSANARTGGSSTSSSSSGGAASGGSTSGGSSSGSGPRQVSSPSGASREEGSGSASKPSTPAAVAAGAEA